jgi:hypothetical protein
MVGHGAIYGNGSNRLSRTMQEQNQDRLQGDSTALRMVLGKISEINQDNGVFIKVEMSNGDMFGGDTSTGLFVPLIQELDFIQSQYGPLALNMPIRILYTGTSINPRNAMAEVIGKADVGVKDFEVQQPVTVNEIGAGLCITPGIF